MIRRSWLGAVAWSFASACASPPSAADGDASSSGEPGSSSGGTSATDVSPDTTSGGPDLPAPDTTPVGIGIARIELAQGSSVALYRGGAVVEPGDRGAAVVSDRPALVRVEVELAEDFVARPIVATLQLETDPGLRPIEDVRMVESGAAPAFEFAVPAEPLRPETAWSVTLAEDEPGTDVGASVASPTRVPADAAAALGVADGPHTLEIVVVPFDYDDGAGCATSPVLDDAVLQRFEDALYQQLPIDRVVMTVHAREAWTEPFDELLTVNERLIELRTAEAAAPQVVYYGIIDACQPQTGVVGMAYGMLLPTSMEMSFTRCAAGLWWDFDVEEVANTMVHEVGHTLGRLHVVCGGNEGFPTDGSYPVDGGGLDAWGYGVRDGDVRPVEGTADFMSYCEPSWISRHGWNELQPVVQEISTWPTDVDQAPVGRVLFGVVGPDGARPWRVVSGATMTEPPRSATTIDLRVEVDGIVHAITASTWPLPEDPTRTVVVAGLPAGGSVGRVRWGAG